MESNPISVVIPLYNKELTISRAIKSIICQLSADDEVIVVDDGSVDLGRETIYKIYGSNKAIRVIQQQNQGVSAARNRGVEEATHPHVVFLDADDWWLPGFRARIAELIRKWPEALAWSVGHQRVSGSRQLVVNSGLSKDALLQGNEFIRQYGKFSGLINSSSVCVNKNTLISFGGFPVGATSGEDIYVWLRLALLGSIAFSPEPLVAIDRPIAVDLPEKARDTVGYHYRFFNDRNVIDRLTTNQRLAIKSFMLRNGLRQVAGSVAAGRRSKAISLAKWIASVVPSFWLLVIPMMLIPKPVYVFLFNRRHRLPA